MPTLLAGVDRAAFVAALVHRLRTRGVDVGMTSAAAFTEALEVVPPVRVGDLYWSARITLVSRQEDLASFDRVFDAAFADAVLTVDPHARRTGTAELPERPSDGLAPVPGDRDEGGTGSTLPWHTLPRHEDGIEDDDNPVVLPEVLPSAVARIADTPLDELDGRELALLGRWLERSAHEWPTRRSRRLGVGATGSRIALRATMAASRRTGGEAFALRRLEAVRRPLPVTLLCDVSQSMQSHSTAYLHLMRAFARSRQAETFAFSTSLTRLTPALRQASPTAAIALASAQVVDRYGGTHLAGCLKELLASRHAHGIRGGVLVIASDGWDSDPPGLLTATMARASRRARRVVWLNPRAAVPGFQPLVGSMAAALPYCDAFLPAHTLRGLDDVLAAISGGLSSRA
ncbi:MAG TPA: VWA domain-containing protein [Marmoricola sp.]